MDFRINAGYIITDSIHIGNVEFVLGVNSKEPSMFVTWECQGGSNYYWGHYTSDLTAAKKDLLERARCELEFQEHRKERANNAPQKDNNVPFPVYQTPRSRKKQNNPQDISM